jgi:transcription antitermination factor NusG
MNYPGRDNPFKKSESYTKSAPLSMNESWHVIHTIAHRERAAALLLCEQGIDTFCPMQVLNTLVRGQTQESIHALFLGYLFAYWDSNNAYQWYTIMNTSGVINILGGGTPTRIEPGVVEDWIARAGDQDVIEDLVQSIADIKRGYKLHDEVRISRGAYDMLLGTVVWIDDTKQQVGVKVSIFGRTLVIVRRTTDCVLHALAPLSSSTLRRRGHLRGGRRGHRARVKAFSTYLDKNSPS